jgi:F420H(2)-dependent quinone reductase
VPAPSDSLISKFTRALPDGWVRRFGRLNIPLYRLTRGRVAGHIGRAPVLLLTTTGRKSGEERTTPVVYMEDGERYVVIGSNAGNDREPAWALNLVEHPDAEVEAFGDKKKVRARVAEGEERDGLWRRSNEQYAGFDDYKAKTGRDIAVFVLEPR